jgi:alkylhydroperoxidase/carboxymuconolactone decarboxylase family protein YurZ
MALALPTEQRRLLLSPSVVTGEVLGQTPEQVERSLRDLAPRLATYVVETNYGDIYQNETLDPRTLQIVTVAAPDQKAALKRLTVLSSSSP